ncbi:DUF881 domain-containing protein [Bifidobacterium favimelis]|uniref:DUF881 domain-containing protein n=1 Tax=Bifidobacterium favimelis TaxID=3122979 RepID=A0ABU8ZNV5_9BIFI
MNDKVPGLPSFAVPPDRTLIHRRAVFSGSAAGLSTRYVNGEGSQPGAEEARRRKLDDESLRLIDDLTNRPMDPMFEDARLLAGEHRSQLNIWATRVIVFIICTVVGLAGTGIVQVLNRDPRQKVRQKLIAQVEDVRDRSETLSGDITSMRSQIEALSSQAGASHRDPVQEDDDITNGASSVTGGGVSVVLSNPISNTENQDPNTKVKLVRDDDLQWVVSLLWGAGAEAVAINGSRIGTQTSVRTAGQTILVGTSSVESPYTVEAIGDPGVLAAAFDKAAAQPRLDSMRQANIRVRISKERSITLKAVGMPNLSYARRSH